VTSEHGQDNEEIENPEELFLHNLETIERAIRVLSWRGSLRDDDAEDFASYVKLKLIEKEYAILRKYQKRASFAAYIAVVVQRMLLDYRIGQWGKWHASTEAKRLGEPAITLEAFLYRDGHTLDEAMPMLLRRWPELTREFAENVLRRLPFRRPRIRLVAFERLDDVPAIFSDPPVFEAETENVARRVALIVRGTLARLEERDRLIFRLRFQGEMSIAEIARTLQTEQKPLYRRFHRALTLLRTRLEEAGVSGSDIDELLSRRFADLDFGFGDGPSEVPPPTREGR
jgi:RNA polymerase sigma factor (sigma-70 family)